MRINNVKLIYRNRGSVPITWGLLVAATFLGIGAPVLDDAPLSQYVVFWGATPFVLFLLHRIGIRPRLECDDHGVSIVGGFKTHFVEWDDISRFEPGLQLIVVKTDGSQLFVPSVTSAPIKEIRGEEGNVDRVSRELNEVLAKRRGLAPSFLELSAEDRQWRRAARRRWALISMLVTLGFGIVILVVTMVTEN